LNHRVDSVEPGTIRKNEPLETILRKKRVCLIAFEGKIP